MRAAGDRVVRVCKCKNVCAVGGVVLQSDFDFDVPALAFYVDRRIVQRGFTAVEMLNEFTDAAGEAELRGLFGALVRERDLQALIQEGQFAQALRHCVTPQPSFLKNGSLAMLHNFRTRLARLAVLL